MEIDRAALNENLKKAGVARTAEAKGEKVERQPIIPDNPVGIPDTVPVLFREGSDYYRTPRAQHPRAPNRYPVRSLDLIANYSSYAL